MIVLRILILISLLSLTVKAQETYPQLPLVAPASCPVTTPPTIPFIPPSPFPTAISDNSFWIGTEKLWIGLRKENVWGWGPRAPGHENDLTSKTFWMSKDFHYDKEYPPGLTVTGRRLDGPAPPLRTMRTTNAFPGPTAAMLSGVIVPVPGCWEITGDYKGERLSFVVWVTQLVNRH